MVLLLMMIKESSSTKLNRCFYINNFRLKDRAVFYSFLDTWLCAYATKHTLKLNDNYRSVHVLVLHCSLLASHLTV